MSDNVSIVKQNQFPLFPKSTDRGEFNGWLRKARAFLHDADLSIYTSINRSVACPCLNAIVNDNQFKPKYDHKVDFIDKGDDAKQAKDAKNAFRAFNLLLQSLNEKQMVMTQDICEGNAYMIMHRLKANYQLSSSSSSVQVLIACSTRILETRATWQRQRE